MEKKNQYSPPAVVITIGDLLVAVRARDDNKWVIPLGYSVKYYYTWIFVKIAKIETSDNDDDDDDISLIILYAQVK